jgi:hypothetical protein
MPSVTVTLNGKRATGNGKPRIPVVQFVRSNLALWRCGVYRQIIEAVTGCGAQAQGRVARLSGL